MALIECPECTKEISDKVKSCPHCGFPFDAKRKIKQDTQQIARNVSNNKPDLLKKSTIYLGGGIGLVILIAVSFFAIKTIQSQVRINRFNSELQNRLMEDSEAKISVNGVYADLITHEDGDAFKEFLSLAKNETEKKNMQNLVYSTYQLICLDYFIERHDLIDEYINKDDYINDDKFIKSQELTPTCRIKGGEDIYEFFKDERGDYVFTVNGETIEIP